ncbi:hypothetical protein Tco_0399686 [Tanacetum coccineum]
MLAKFINEGMQENEEIRIFIREFRTTNEHLMMLKTKFNDDEPWTDWGHHSASIIARKVYEFGFYWPSNFKDAKEYVMKCDACQRSGNILSRSEMPQNNIQICEVFDVWELDFMGSFPDSRGKLKSKWYGPNIVKTVYSYGAVEITDKNGFSFKVNGQRLKKYCEDKIDRKDEEVVEFVTRTM